MTENSRLETAAPAIVIRMTTFSKERRFLADSSFKNASSDIVGRVGPSVKERGS
jgi:hypothetical protein